MREIQREEKKEKKRNKKKRGVRNFTFSLKFTEIEPSFFVEAKGKVHRRDESFA